VTHVPLEDQRTRGETLIELLVSMTILGITVVALVGGIGTSIVVSDMHRKQAVAGVAVRSYAEAIESSVDATPSSYVGCATGATYATPPNFTAPSGYTASVTGVAYWIGNGYGACSAGVGIEKLTLSVSSNDSRATETMNLIIRKPCREADPCTGPTS
jgi:type II secretory pathway pseudopilin PulG